MAQERNVKVDVEGYERLMEAQKKAQNEVIMIFYYYDFLLLFFIIIYDFS